MPKKRAQNALTVAQAAQLTKEEWRAGLTHKEQAFVCEYLKDFNARAAAERCGSTAPSAHQAAHRLLHSPRVKMAIERLFASKGVQAQRIVEEIAAVAFAKVTDYVEVRDGRVVVKDTTELDETQQRAIGEIHETITKYGTAIHVKLADKLGALNSLARAAGLHKDRVEVSGEVKHSHEVSREAIQETIENLFERLAERQSEKPMKVIEHEPVRSLPAENV